MPAWAQSCGARGRERFVGRTVPVHLYFGVSRDKCGLGVFGFRINAQKMPRGKASAVAYLDSE